MIYIHIPFCKQACHYCDFHFSTSLQYKADMVQAILKEITLRSDYLTDKTVDSIYFGGGTPSLLDVADVARIIDRVANHYEVSPTAEITLEANPDDLGRSKVQALRQTAVNRFSVGIQSFYEEDLRWMNRAHNAQEADAAVKRIQDAGFENITCDLIYGFPLLTNEKWHSNIQKLIDFGIPHISSYSMTVEQRTALDHFIKLGKTPPMAEEQSAEQMNILIDRLTTANFEQYEISNFAKSAHYAKHNTNYWRGIHYLGIGPSAHSFNGITRSWNIANNAKYIQSIEAGKPLFETEVLTQSDQINEYIMTALRTMWGIDLDRIISAFGSGAKDYILRSARPFIDNGQLHQHGQQLVLSNSGKLFADHIASELFRA